MYGGCLCYVPPCASPCTELGGQGPWQPVTMASGQASIYDSYSTWTRSKSLNGM